ncbi:MAG: sensor histidine kinase [Aureliella sp.]
MLLKPWLSKQSIRFAPVVMITSALALVLLIGCWGMYRDLRSVRASVTSAEIAQIRSHEERTVTRISNSLSRDFTLMDFLSDPDNSWLEDYWRRTILGEPARLYSAVVSLDDVTLAHSSSLGIGGHIAGQEATDSRDAASGGAEVKKDPVSSNQARAEASTPKGRKSALLLPKLRDAVQVADYGPGVHLLERSPQTDGKRILDIQIPIMSEGNVVGYYRTGLEYGMFEGKIRAAQGTSIRGWSIVMAGTAVIVVCACLSLYRLGVHSFRLEQALSLAETRRLAELNQLIVGLAHEVRNPLNAVRLNLFTSEKVIRGDTHIAQAEAIAMLRESVGEIERVDGLICQLLGYARINGSPSTCLDVNEEIKSTLQFLKGVHEREQVDVHFTAHQNDLNICIGPQCFRQILLNLLQNACQATGSGGTIEIITQAIGTDAVVSIHDSGPGITDVPLAKIFEPFYSTRENGVGMGLAVVKSLVENAGGLITCRRSGQLTGMEFSLRFPIMKSADMNGILSHG